MAKNENTPAATRPVDTKLLQLVIDEVDEARETYELATQFAKGLPFRGFEDVAKLVNPERGIKFRGEYYDIKQFAGMIPSVVFPIDNLESLITLLAYAVRSAPKRPAVTEPTDAEDARRQLKRLGILGSTMGRLGPNLAVMGSLGVGQAWTTKQNQQPCSGKGEE